ncbi:MAG TPA: hypothetical protein VGA55_04060, partial [Bacteroidota bacterium]
EVMLHRRVRDPETALDPRRLFSRLDEFTDRDLVKAFSSYNKIRTKIPLQDEIIEPRTEQRPSLLGRLISVFTSDRKE